MGTSDITVSGLAAVPDIRGNVLSWTVSDPRNGAIPNLALDAVEVWASLTNDRTTATKVVEGVTTAIHSGLLDGLTYYYWIKPRNKIASYGGWYPSSSTGGVSCTAFGASGLGFTLVNGNIVASVAANALTVAIKTLSGGDPSATSPVLVLFRNSNGSYSTVAVTAATSLVISAGSTLGTVNATAFKLSLNGYNDGGVFRLALVNRWEPTINNGYLAIPTPDGFVSSATAEGGAGGADTALASYATVNITSKPRVVLGTLEWNSGLATVGNWSATPDVIRLYGPGRPRTGDVVFTYILPYTTNTTTTTTIPFDDTIPQKTEGSISILTMSVTPISGANLLEVDAVLYLSHTVGGRVFAALFKDTGADALAAGWSHVPSADGVAAVPLRARFRTDSTTARDYMLRFGSDTAGTVSICGISTARRLGGTLASTMKISEIEG